MDDNKIRVVPVKYRVTDGRYYIYLEPDASGHFILTTSSGKQEFVFARSSVAVAKAVGNLILVAAEAVEKLNKKDLLL